MKPGLSNAPEFKRLIIPTVNKSWAQKIKAAFVKPRVEMLSDFHIPYSTGVSIVIPKGFDSDGGSIPLFGLWATVAISYYVGFYVEVSLILLLLGLALNSFGLMLSPFLVHDFAVRYKKVILSDGTLLHIEDVTQANKLMLKINFAVNRMPFLSIIAYIGVTIGAWWSWRQHRKNDSKGLNNITRWSRLLR